MTINVMLSPTMIFSSFFRLRTNTSHLRCVNGSNRLPLRLLPLVHGPAVDRDVARGVDLQPGVPARDVPHRGGDAAAHAEDHFLIRLQGDDHGAASLRA